jgi:hypothetical protein
MSAAQWNVYDHSEPQVASDKRAANPTLNFPNLVADSSSFSNLGQTASNANAFLPKIYPSRGLTMAAHGRQPRSRPVLPPKLCSDYLPEKPRAMLLHLINRSNKG